MGQIDPAYRTRVVTDPIWDVAFHKVVGVDDVSRVWELRDQEQAAANRERAASWGIKFKIEQRLIDAERRIGWRKPK